MKISVVIPLYNKRRSITATLDSVLAQTYEDYECIIVNDGSTDQSSQVVHDVICNMEDGIQGRFHLINKENGGVSSARNRGVQEAKGEYVAFLDGDDLWAPTYLEMVARLIADCPDAVLYCMGYCELYDDGRKVDVGRTNPNLFGYLHNPWNGEYGFSSGSTAICHRDTLLSIGGFDTRMAYGEDLDVWWRMLLRGKGACCGQPLAYYRQDAENRAMKKVIPLEKHIPFYIDKYQDARRDNPEFRRFFDMQMVYRLYPYLFDKRYKKEAQRIGNLLDYSQLKWSMKFRMQWPWIYRMYEKLKGRNS